MRWQLSIIHWLLHGIMVLAALLLSLPVLAYMRGQSVDTYILYIVTGLLLLVANGWLRWWLYKRIWA